MLERAFELGLTIDDAFIDTTRTRHLTVDERRLDPGDGGYPIDSARCSDVRTLRRNLLRSMATVGRSTGSRCAATRESG